MSLWSKSYLLVADSRVQALRKAGISDAKKCYFVDDNRANIDAAQKLGWNSAHFCEKGLETVEGGKVSYTPST